MFLVVVAFSCKKDHRTIAPMIVSAGVAVQDGVPLCGGIKGTMLTGKTYIIDSCGVIVNQGDTLLIQAGVNIRVNNGGGFTVRGVMLSLGTKAQPVTMLPPNDTKTDNPAALPATDSAYLGKWLGIQCDTTCPLLVLKWTRVDFTGATIKTQTIPALASGKQCYSIVFENITGKLVVEDCWFYGTTNDCIRIQGGYFDIMRCTFEKNGLTGADVVNVKHGSVGIAAYNLFVGTGTNATKASDKGSGVGPQCDFDMYNNTYVNGGWREASTTTGKGADINYEQNAFGNYYNNLVVNCIYGPRIVLNPEAAVSQMSYGYTYLYGDSLDVVNGFYPVGYINNAAATDMPTPNSYLPASFFTDSVVDLYNAPQLAGQNNPQFVNYPLPCPSGFVIAYASGFDFHLKSTSPCIGVGYKNCPVMVTPVPVDPVYGATEITPPGSDIGCYQSDGTGNQH